MNGKIKKELFPVYLINVLHYLVKDKIMKNMILQLGTTLKIASTAS